MLLKKILRLFIAAVLDNGISITIKSRLLNTLLQAWTGLQVSRRLRLPDFKTVGT
jgi:hypothetical protein